MRNFDQINSDLNSHADKIYRLEQVVVALILSGEHGTKAMRLLTELGNDDNRDAA